MNKCKCGCGKDAGTYANTDPRRGEVKGAPKSYLQGHNNFLARSCVERSDLTDFELGWIVGMIEGEGHIGINGHQARITVVSTDKPNLRRIQKSLGCGKIYPRKVRPGWKPSWGWTVYISSDVKAVVEILYPHLSARRRRQCRKAFPMDPRFSLNTR